KSTNTGPPALITVASKVESVKDCTFSAGIGLSLCPLPSALWRLPHRTPMYSDVRLGRMVPRVVLPHAGRLERSPPRAIAIQVQRPLQSAQERLPCVVVENEPGGLSVAGRIVRYAVGQAPDGSHHR